MSGNNYDRDTKSWIIGEVHEANILLDSREIFLHSHYTNDEDGDPGVEYRMGNTFIKNMRILERASSKPIIIHMHSIGGEWCEGMMMYDMIKNSSAFVAVIMHGAAMSMGSIIPLAADLVVSMPSCWWLLHDGSSEIFGHVFKQAESMMEWEKKTRDIMMDIYTNKIMNSKSAFSKGKSEKQIKAHIRNKLRNKEDWWVSSEEAIELGLCDQIFGEGDCKSINDVLRILQL